MAQFAAEWLRLACLQCQLSFSSFTVCNRHNRLLFFNFHSGHKSLHEPNLVNASTYCRNFSPGHESNQSSRYESQFLSHSFIRTWLRWMDTSFVCDLTSTGSKTVSMNVQLSVRQKSVREKKFILWRNKSCVVSF